MPSSPRTPTRRRKSSGVDLSITSPSPGRNGYSSGKPSFSRQSSQYSMTSPPTPHLASSSDISGDFSGSNGFGNPMDSSNSNGNGLGNLADELAEAWDEDEEGLGTSERLFDATGEMVNGRNHGYSDPRPINYNAPIVQSPIPSAARSTSLSPPKQATRSRHRRVNSQYDGSDYGDDSDFENVDGISPSLEARMAAIESLARRGTEANGSDTDNVARRVADSLIELPSQSGIENGTTRLITTHTALTTHLNTCTRTLLTLTHPLTSPLSPPPDPEIISDLLPLLSALLPTLPTPTPQALSQLHSLHAATSDLQSTLTYLSDTIYMTRQTMTSGSRKLRTASETVVEMRREGEAREEAVRWVEKGGWEERLRARDAARVCGEVVGGFEEVCDGWRRRLVGGLEVGVGIA